MAMKEEEGGVIRTKRRAKNDINDERVQCILSLSLSPSLSLFLSVSFLRSPHSLLPTLFIIARIDTDHCSTTSNTTSSINQQHNLFTCNITSSPLVTGIPSFRVTLGARISHHELNHTSSDTSLPVRRRGDGEMGRMNMVEAIGPCRLIRGVSTCV